VIPRTILDLALAAILGLVVVGSADLLQSRGQADPGRPWDRPLFRDFGARGPEGGRFVDERSEVRLAGFWPSAPVAVELTMAAKVERRVRIFSGDRALGDTLIAPEPSAAVFTMPADARGELRLRFAAGRRDATRFILLALRVEQRPPRRLTAERAVLHALLGPLLLLLAGRAADRRRALLVCAGGLALVAAAVALFRLQALAWLPWLVGALAVSWAWLVIAEGVHRALAMPAAAARWVTAAALLRVGLALTPAFGSVDAQWHAHQLWSFAAGEVVSSGAPGVEVSPYPPALYAVLSPFVTYTGEDERLVRLAMGLMEALAPFLVLALVRATRAARAAPAAAVAMAVMPEGLLVLAKGIAANILGSFATLVFLVAVARGAPAFLTAGLLVLVFLSHAPVAFTVALLLAAWWGRDAFDGTASRRETLARAGAVALAAAVAWAAYYREVPLVLQPPDLAGDPGIVGVRWYRAGKLAQDVVLKFGLGPVLLALAGMAPGGPAEGTPVLRRLLQAWFLVGGALGLLALVSRFPLRFEYFLAPAVAAAAGLGAERWRTEGRGRWVTAAWVVAFAIQAAIGLAWLAGRFEIISVIMESPRWPFPVRL
jgi:hypothetical protein